ncbi:hypothetical protein ACWKSP_02190 [Micromonosporaceae bacterium Da 78-11]
MASISGLGSTTVGHFPTRAAKKDDQDPMAKVAGVLGLSKDDLKSALSSGKSLNDVAEEQGVSHDDLISAIKQGMPAEQTSATGQTETADQVAEEIASTVGMPPPPPGEVPGGPKGENSALQDAGKLSRLSELLDVAA